MAYAEAKSTDSKSIPVVDIAPLRDGSDKAIVAQALHAASQSLGFIYIKNHGIPDSVIHHIREQALEFFRQTDKQKDVVKVSTHHRGWLKPGASKMADDEKADLKESFIWSFQNDRVNEDHPLRGSNQWPVKPEQFQSSALGYLQYAHDVACILMRGFAVGLGLDENFFLQSNDKPLSRASCVYYPVQPEDAGVDQFGVAPHTDFGVLTVLCQDENGGLQVQDLNGDWIHAPSIEGTLVVNVGDLLSRWTAGEYRSTPHRVVNTSGRERLSLVLAFDPNPETRIDANDIPGLTAIEDPTTCADYLQWRFSKAFSYRSKST